MRALILGAALIALVHGLVLPPDARAQEAAANRQQFLIVLRPAERLQGPDPVWTEEDNRVVGAHFQRLKRLTEEWVVLLAGRTTNEDSTMFGLVIFEAESEEEARVMMEEDPAVHEGVMTATLFPYRVALVRKEF